MANATEPWYVAIDEMTAKLERQVMRHKEKMQSHSKDVVKRAPVL